MASYYTMYDSHLCPYCHKIVDEIIFFTNACDAEGLEQGFDTGQCNHCDKKFRIDMEFVLNKL
jgi:hypothetical protein